MGSDKERRTWAGLPSVLGEAPELPLHGNALLFLGPESGQAVDFADLALNDLTECAGHGPKGGRGRIWGGWREWQGKFAKLVRRIAEQGGSAGICPDYGAIT
jgi:hypothetical protein